MLTYYAFTAKVPWNKVYANVSYIIITTFKRAKIISLIQTFCKMWFDDTSAIKFIVILNNGI